MKSLGLTNYALSIGAAVAFLGGCGAAQPLIASTGAAPQNRLVATRADRHKSGSSNDLIYVSASHDSVYMLDYPSGQLIGKFNPPSTYVAGMCADPSGEVYVVGWAGNPEVIKYLHGALKPSGSMNVPGQTASACSVDPISGNLAVLARNSDDKVQVAIYPSGSGSPTTYIVSDELSNALSCAYDDSGGLFVDFHAFSGVRRLAELAAGAQTFTQLRVRTVKISQLFWTSSYLAVGNPSGLYDIRVSAGRASIIGRTTVLNGKPHFWIQGGTTLLEPFGNDANRVGFWLYPQGGKVIKTYGHIDGQFRRINSIVVSAASSN